MSTKLLWWSKNDANKEAALFNERYSKKLFTKGRGEGVLSISRCCTAAILSEFLAVIEEKNKSSDFELGEHLSTLRRRLQRMKQEQLDSRSMQRQNQADVDNPNRRKRGVKRGRKPNRRCVAIMYYIIIVCACSRAALFIC